MKKFLFVIAYSLLLIGCKDGTSEVNSSVGVMCVHKVSFEGHRYLVFSTSLGEGVAHDQNCECFCE